jgi:hypothetical protein
MSGPLPAPRRDVSRSGSGIDRGQGASPTAAATRLTGPGRLGLMLLRLVLSFFFRAFRSSGAYKEAVARARSHRGVLDALGGPIDPGFWVGGSIHVSGSTGSASLATPLHGSRGDGMLRAEARKAGGVWTFDRLLVQVRGGATIDLLSGDPRLPALEIRKLPT